MKLKMLALVVLAGLGAATAAISSELPDRSAAEMQAADLRAQQSMAKTARDALVPTWWQVAFGAASTAGLIITLCVTVRSLKMSRRTLDATREAMAMQRAATRAYLSVKVAQVVGLDIGQKPVVYIDTTNAGVTPAYNVVTKLALRIVPNGANYDRGDEQAVGSTTINAGSSSRSFIMMRDALTDGQLAQVALGSTVPEGAFLVITGVINYDDVFGQRNETNLGYAIGMNGECRLLSECSKAT
ncbi:hypothetical protein [Brevundimonas diminuta]|uniref:hypothetical protein n=1 Tax=Brevundimonas diminuta TaxID=293 RepID=UPI00320B18A8